MQLESEFPRFQLEGERNPDHTDFSGYIGCVITCHGFASEVSGLVHGHGTSKEIWQHALGIFVSSDETVLYCVLRFWRDKQKKIDRTRSTSGITPKCLIRQYDVSGKTICVYNFQVAIPWKMNTIILRASFAILRIGWMCAARLRWRIRQDNCVHNFQAKIPWKMNTFILRASFPILRIGCIGTMMWLNDMDAAVFG